MSKQRCEPVSTCIHLFFIPFTWLWCVCFVRTIQIIYARRYDCISTSQIHSASATMQDQGVDTHIIFAGSSLRPGAPGFHLHSMRSSTEAELTMLGSDGLAASSRPAPASASGTAGVRVRVCVDVFVPLSICLSHRVNLSLSVSVVRSRCFCPHCLKINC
jgi:hypothetical protein